MSLHACKHLITAAAKLHWLQECELSTKKQPDFSKDKPTGRVYLSSETTRSPELGSTSVADMQLLKSVKGSMIRYGWHTAQKTWSRNSCKMVQRGALTIRIWGITMYSLYEHAACKTSQCRHCQTSRKGTLTQDSKLVLGCRSYWDAQS